MKAEEWLTYFMKIYGRRPKMTEVDEAIQNGSLLANRAEVEALLPASKKGFWESLSQFVVTHKVAASVLAISCMTLLGGGAIFAWHSHNSQTSIIPSFAVASSNSQASSSDKSKQSSSKASDSSSGSSSQSQSASSEAKTPAMDVEAIRNGDFSSIEGDWVSDGGHVVTITKSGLTKSEDTVRTDGKTVVKDFNGQPMFYFADNGPGHGVNPFVPVPANQAAPSPDNSVKDTDRLVQIPESSGPGVVYTSYYRVKSKSQSSQTSQTQTTALWNSDKAAKLASYMVEFGHKMNQESYKRLTPNGSDDFYGAMSFAKNNRITVGEKTEQNAPMTNQQKADVAFSDDGTGTADYLIVDSYGYSGSAMILYHFTIHNGQPVVLVSLQNQGNPENMYYMYPTNNKDIQEAFANIVNGK
ncbi:MAG: DUF4767 domain-containing protein [Streptococcus sp.]|uniref:DUF4767 domain-containing protein n=1 Tax=Streptococcus sp. TaxID=1306 RepID=UPI0025F33524|nr:DUF4767 domain-containing protein [Streptococcus sp.]MBS7137861.1 DUF4767 domain-containing protein [Streptococcus sp.]